MAEAKVIVIPERIWVFSKTTQGTVVYAEQVIGGDPAEQLGHVAKTIYFGKWAFANGDFPAFMTPADILRLFTETSVLGEKVALDRESVDTAVLVEATG